MSIWLWILSMKLRNFTITKIMSEHFPQPIHDLTTLTITVFEPDKTRSTKSLNQLKQDQLSL